MVMGIASKTSAGKRMQGSDAASPRMFMSNEARCNNPADRERNQRWEIPLLDRLKVVKNREQSEQISKTQQTQSIIPTTTGIRKGRRVVATA